MRDTFDTFNTLLECSDADSLLRASGDQFARRGFEHWSYGDAQSMFQAGDYPRDWLAHYQRQGYFELDPVVSHCRQHATPCLWSADAAARPLGHTTGFFQEAIGFGLRIGVSLPMHGPAGRWSMVSVARARLPSRALAFSEIAELHLLASFVYEARQRLDATRSKVSVHLTQREADALRWAAEGKTSWEIGQLLGIGERTVVFHLGNAAAKLGVTGRRQAIARAIALDLISL